MAEWQASVDRFCYQYLQLEAEPTLPSPEILKLSEVQEAIYENAFDDGLCHAPPPRYQHRVLKALLSAIEKGIDDWEQYAVSDNLMSAMAVLLATPLPSEVDSVQQKRYVTYALSLLPPVETNDATATMSSSSSSSSSSWPSITLLENRTLLSAGGTTGRRTWEAALHMGQFLCTNPSIVSGKRVLELGAGTGYLSILCARYLHAAHVTASDGSEDVLNNLSENLSLNGLSDEDGSDGGGGGSSKLITRMNLKWGHALMGTGDRQQQQQLWNEGRNVDVVLGADLTYDATAIPFLVATLLDLFGLYPHVEVYIAAAERNRETFKVFLDMCSRHRLHVEDLRYGVAPRAQQTGPFYADNVDIHTCRVMNSAGRVYENKL